MRAVSIFLLNGIVVLLLLMGTLKVFSEDAAFAAVQDNDVEYDYYPWSGKGPEHWGNLRLEWAACKNGTQQSPINITTRKVTPVNNSEDLQINYKPANTTLQNRGHDIALQWMGDAGSVKIKGLSYSLIQCHWHSPSEHTVDGMRFVLEQHCVHQREEGNKTTIAVIGTLYDIGRPDPFLFELEGPIKYISTGRPQNQTYNGIMDPMDMTISNEYYRYEGSLTTPPCTEGVIWTIDRRVKTVSSDQVTLLKNAVKPYARHNARPLQQVNKREIFWYKRKHQENLDTLISEMK